MQESTDHDFHIHLIANSPVLPELAATLSWGQHFQVTQQLGISSQSPLCTETDIILVEVENRQVSELLAWAANELKACTAQVALVTRRLQAQSVIRLMRAGFSEVFDLNDDLELLHEWILQHFECKLRAAASGEESTVSSYGAELVGASLEIAEIRSLAKQAAEFPELTVLIQGETGTGKELIARLIHESSARARGPFIEVNCSAIPESLMEAEMFGYEKGAFTDARRTKKGFFELADGGTLFLDEIGVMSPNLQNKLLKVVEDKSFRRIGGEHLIKVTTRVIAGTNSDLEAAMAQDLFRPDLYYRLRVFTLTIPPLRRRRQDIIILAQHFLHQTTERYELVLSGFHPSTRRLLEAYSWPGNVRELKHTIERAAVLARRGRILPSHLPEEIQRLELEDTIPSTELTFGPTPTNDRTLCIPLPEEGLTMETLERMVIDKVLELCGGNQSKAANYLKISRSRLLRKLPKKSKPARDS